MPYGAVMRIIFSCLLFIFISCGKSELAVVGDKDKPVVSGEAYQYVIIRLEFIKDIREICEARYLSYEYPTYQLYEQEVAKCTLDNLSVLNLANLQQFANDVCSDPKTQEEIDACNALNGI